MALRRLLLNFEVLWDDEITPDLPELNLGEIYEETIDGHASGRVTTLEDDTVPVEVMQWLLERQGSDPDFLGDPIGEEEEHGWCNPALMQFLSSEEIEELRNSVSTLTVFGKELKYWPKEERALVLLHCLKLKEQQNEELAKAFKFQTELIERGKDRSIGGD